SGSALVFRNEIYNSFWPPARTVMISGHRLSNDQLADIAKKQYPAYFISHVWDVKRPDQTVEIWLDRRGKTIQREFDPYTGRNLGNRSPFVIKTLSWLVELHGDLLGRRPGRVVNGIGGLLLAVVCFTGAVIWWPGVATWRRS